MQKVIPDDAALEKVEREHPTKSDGEKWRLAQADTLLRLAKAKDMDELHRMAKAGLLDSLIEEHNAKRKLEGEE
jgi:hypothetical protein